MYCGTPTFWQRGLWDSCFQNPSESSGSPGMQLWTHYDVSWISLYFVLVLYHLNNNYRGMPGWEGGGGGT